MTDRQDKQGKEAPWWVALATYLACWGIGGWILLAEQAEPNEPSRVWILVGIGLLLFPILSFDGLGRAIVRTLARLLDRAAGPPSE